MSRRDRFAHTPGPWEMHTSNSWRRIGTFDGRKVCEPTVHPRDGWPDLHFPNGGPEGPDAKLVIGAPALLAAAAVLLDIIDAVPLKSSRSAAEKAAIQRLRDEVSRHCA